MVPQVVVITTHDCSLSAVLGANTAVGNAVNEADPFGENRGAGALSTTPDFDEKRVQLQRRPSLRAWHFKRGIFVTALASGDRPMVDAVGDRIGNVYEFPAAGRLGSGEGWGSVGVGLAAGGRGDERAEGKVSNAVRVDIVC